MDSRSDDVVLCLQNEEGDEIRRWSNRWCQIVPGMLFLESDVRKVPTVQVNETRLTSCSKSVIVLTGRQRKPSQLDLSLYDTYCARSGSLMGIEIPKV